jgi:GNAT superfamily N-acetyltransferase
MMTSSHFPHLNTLTRALQHHGVIKCCTLALSEALQSVLNHLYLHERHVWFVLSTHSVRAVSLADGMILQPVSGPQVDLLSEQALCGRRVVENYLRHRGQPWVVMDGQRVAFCCWIFTKEMPLVVARGGWHALPVSTACLEASVTSADYRGRGIAPAAWLGIAAILKERGIHRMVTKVEEDNAASRRAVVKAGFHEIAVVDFQRMGLSRYKTIEPRSILHLNDLETLVDLQLDKA